MGSGRWGETNGESNVAGGRQDVEDGQYKASIRRNEEVENPMCIRSLGREGRNRRHMEHGPESILETARLKVEGVFEGGKWCVFVEGVYLRAESGA